MPRRRCWSRSKPWIPRKYPYYGEVKLDPPMTLDDALRPDTWPSAQDVLLRLNAKVGDPLRIGTETFRIVGVIVSANRTACPAA